ncbi:MAG TPA: glutathione S-transferase family protein [Kiloniellaceae bacterium]|nr:glutathione S-transferase family protein [Kiloniellaceae bacterium]
MTAAGDAAYLLYGGLYTRAAIVEMVLAEGDIPYRLQAVDILNGEHRSPAYRAVSPTGLVPTLITPEGRRLHETPAICLYLAERHGLTHLVPAVDDPLRGPFLSALFHLTGELEPELKRYFYPQRYAPRAEDNAAVRAQALGRAHGHFAVIEAALAAAGPFRLGAQLSLVDLTLAFWMDCLAPAARPPACPAIAACCALVTARPKLQPIFAAIQDWRDDYARRDAAGGGAR